MIKCKKTQVLRNAVQLRVSDSYINLVKKADYSNFENGKKNYECNFYSLDLIKKILRA